MYRNPKEFPEYGDTPKNTNDIDYAHPGYYGQEVPTPPRSDQPVQPLDPYAPYPEYSGYGSDYGTQNYTQAPSREHSSPMTMEEYANAAHAEQHQAQAGSNGTDGKKRKWAGLGGIGATAGALLLKFPALAFIFKFGFAGITALVSIAIYSIFLGWPFAVGLVALLFIHEMGHAVVMKIKGIPVGGMIFIPMLGAAVTMRQMPQNARDEAEVGIAGPIAGAIASSACLFIAMNYAHAGPIWAALAYFGFFMNLFNLIPIVPFDGGRVLAAIDRRVWIVGFIGLLAFQIWSWLHGTSSFWLLFFIFMAATQLWSRGGNARTPYGRDYYNVPVSTRIVLSLLYFGLAAVLYLGMSISHSLMPIY